MVCHLVPAFERFSYGAALQSTVETGRERYGQRPAQNGAQLCAANPTKG